ncbi:hypothetical protein [Streptomyces gilvosporeus]|uniref:Uncharacterized protein n=1 Tax=Streptomyces gilvosporeus TaxID=553510 RepID=A0A1V0U216_9ACTN|nr:hypothetical protein [Streptomyces gilvosporeus]ARF58972.1 hypothetical protein B1H19_36615 [Streptomyces gilvosporeus]
MRAMWHAWRTGHRPWHEELFRPGERAMAYFYSCREQFRPLTKEAPYPDRRDNPVRRERAG